jgi:hypothetical protein
MIKITAVFASKEKPYYFQSIYKNYTFITNNNKNTFESNEQNYFFITKNDGE